jgi:phenylacetate-CoA ligase
MDNFDRIVTDPRLRRSELEAHLSGPEPERPYLGRYKLFTTAGTTGVRGLFVEDAGEFASWIATCLRGLASWGLGPATRLAGIGSPSPLHISPSVAAALAEEQLQGRLRISPGLVATSSEVQTADMRRRMAAAWG